MSMIRLILTAALLLLTMPLVLTNEQRGAFRKRWSLPSWTKWENRSHTPTAFTVSETVISRAGGNPEKNVSRLYCNRGQKTRSSL